MKRAGWIVVFLCASTGAFAQMFSGQTSDKKLYYGLGGTFGAGTSGGYRYNYYSIFPVIGYHITPELSAGTGLTYQHYGWPDVDYSYSQYGVMPFLRYNFKQLFFQTEYDLISSPNVYYPGYGDGQRQAYSRLLFGVGYSLPLSQSGRGAIHALAMYDVLWHQPSVFASPIVARVFVTF